MELSRNNHYIPRMYLSRWRANGRISAYRLLVSHEKVPLWNRESIKRVGCLPNLYVNVRNEEELDTLEHDLDSLIESPAKIPFNKICVGERLTAEEWRKVCRYIAVQYVRTPAFYFWAKDLGAELLKQELDRIGKQLENLKEIPKEEKHSTVGTDYLPVNVRITDVKPDEKHTYIEISATAGKGLWLFEIKQTMEPSSILRRYFQRLRWNIIYAPDGENWPTCDNPVIVCDINNDRIIRSPASNGLAGKNKGILFPVSPKIVLLATTVRSYRWNNIQADETLALMIRKAIVNNAMMYVYSYDEDMRIPLIRNRTVDESEYSRLKNDFDSWFETYKEIEGPLLNRRF